MLSKYISTFVTNICDTESLIRSTSYVVRYTATFVCGFTTSARDANHAVSFGVQIMYMLQVQSGHKNMVNVSLHDSP